jgi:hemerythrin
MLRWSEKFETGHALIDSQHQMLVSYINQLEGLTRTTTNPSRQEVEFCLQLIGFMDTYISVHFAHEEHCMESFKCPARHENKKAHHDFLQFFWEFKLRFDSEGCRPEIVRELHATCSSWIQQHILQIDRQLKPCLSRPAPKQPE